MTRTDEFGILPAKSRYKGVKKFLLSKKVLSNDSIQGGTGTGKKYRGVDFFS